MAGSFSVLSKEPRVFVDFAYCKIILQGKNLLSQHRREDIANLPGGPRMLSLPLSRCQDLLPADHIRIRKHHKRTFSFLNFYKISIISCKYSHFVESKAFLFHKSVILFGITDLQTYLRGN